MKLKKLLEAYYLPKLSDKEESRLLNMLRKQSKKFPQDFEKSLAHLNMVRKSEGLKPITKEQLFIKKPHDIADALDYDFKTKDINKPVRQYKQLIGPMYPFTGPEGIKVRDKKAERQLVKTPSRVPLPGEKIRDLTTGKDLSLAKYKKRMSCVKCGQPAKEGSNYCQDCWDLQLGGKKLARGTQVDIKGHKGPHSIIKRKGENYVVRSPHGGAFIVPTSDILKQKEN